MNDKKTDLLLQNTKDELELDNCGDLQPLTSIAQLLRQNTNEQRWQTLVHDANRRADVLNKVKEHHKDTGLSLRQCLPKVAPEIKWPTYVTWKRKHRSRNGPDWERLLDERLPPPPPPISSEIKQAACLLRRANRSINPDEARKLLSAQFGQNGDISDASLRRIWAAADLTWEAPKDRAGQQPGEQVIHYNGGGGLVLIGAAETELNPTAELAKAVLEAGKEQAKTQGAVEVAKEQPGQRNRRGQFSSEYNQLWRNATPPGEPDGRLDSDEVKRTRRVLSVLPTLAHQEKTLASRLLCMGLVPLLTERRGFVGLEGPAGQWLEVLGSQAYMPRTLDKTLAELGLLGVDEALWQKHAKQWHEQSQKWSKGGPDWLRWAVYVDATHDPYWTRHFAKSGKVSRVGRIMPCLTRVAITSGPGGPLVVETHAGTVSLTKRLVPLLLQLEQWVGKGTAERMTIIDSEMATSALLWTLEQELKLLFVSVLKGKVLSSAVQKDHGPWEPFRHNNQVRSLKVVLKGKSVPEEGFEMRGVEMRRPGSRKARSTLFVTNSNGEQLVPTEVAAAYLSRWPNQEQLFRNCRNGGGLNRSHGYGGQHVTNVTFRTKVDRASRSLNRAKDQLSDAEEFRDILDSTTAKLGKSDKQQKRIEDKAIGDVSKAQKAVEAAQSEVVDKCKMPQEIYARDTTRDNIMTCLKLNMLLLVEYVLKEYFGGYRMELRTFIEQYVMLAVTVRTTESRVLYQLHSNPRQPQRMQQLQVACEELNKRRVRRGKRLLCFEVIEAATG